MTRNSRNEEWENDEYPPMFENDRNRSIRISVRNASAEYKAYLKLVDTLP